MAAFTAEPAGMSTGVVAPGRELRADEETDCELPVTVGTTGGTPPAPVTVGAAARVWETPAGVAGETAPVTLTPTVTSSCEIAAD